MLKKASGNRLFDFGQFVPLPFSENFGEQKKNLLENKNNQNESKKILQVIIPLNFSSKNILSNMKHQICQWDSF